MIVPYAGKHMQLTGDGWWFWSLQFTSRLWEQGVYARPSVFEGPKFPHGLPVKYIDPRGD